MSSALIITALAATNGQVDFPRASPTPPNASTAPVEALLERLLPGLSSHFQLHIGGKPSCFAIDDDDSPGHHDDSPGHKISVVAGDVSTLAAGVGYYLRERANLTIGWPRGGGSYVALPPGGWPTMASSGGRASICRATPHSYFMNVCTHSYSLVWYSWAEWQHMIDWMSLRGINLFLALTGQEEVQYRALSSFGVADKDIRGWFNGPAFLTWSRGQNEYGSGIAGPLPRSFMRSQFALQKRILARTRSLGMTGQLPGFQGNVPVQLKQRLKDSNMTTRGATAWMDSLDPNFGTVADVWMKELTSAFGTDHWYQLDGYFNGGTAPWLLAEDSSDSRSGGGNAGSGITTAPSRGPPIHDSALWRRRGVGAYTGLNRTDPMATWSFQGFAYIRWKHTKGFIDAAPPGKFVVVDMDYGEGEWFRWAPEARTPFIWTKLHDFGGTDGLKGNLTRAAELPWAALQRTPPADVAGTGFTSEGIDQNPAYYDLILDAHFSNASASHEPTAYVVARALKRYGVARAAGQLLQAGATASASAAASAAAATAAASAWQKLAASVYSKDESVQDYTGVPHLPGEAHWAWTADRYTPTAKMCQLYSAWGDLITVASSTRRAMATAIPAAEDTGANTLSAPLRYDLIDVGREVLAQIATPLSQNLSEAMHATPHADPSAVATYGDAYVQVLTDLDELVATEEAFLLGPWIKMARAVGRAEHDNDSDAANDDASESPAAAHEVGGEEEANDCTGAFAPTIPPEVVGCAHFYEWNARCQLTTWNPVPKGATSQPKGPIDYASKHWSGLINDYYRDRAKLLMAAATKHAAAGELFTAAMDDAVRASHAYAFQVATGASYPTEPVGDALEVSKRMRAKYAPRLRGCA